MDVTKQIQKLVEYIETYCKDQLAQRIKKDEKYLILDFSELITFAPELADELLERPEELIKATEIAIEHFDVLGDVKNFKASPEDPTWDPANSMLLGASFKSVAPQREARSPSMLPMAFFATFPFAALMYDCRRFSIASCALRRFETMVESLGEYCNASLYCSAASSNIPLRQ